MTVPRAKKATQQKERQQLIQDIKQQNPSITDKQLSKYNIDDLRKIKINAGVAVFSCKSRIRTRTYE